GHGVHFFSRGAARMPNANIRISSQQGDNLLPKYPEQIRVAKHFRHRNRQVVYKTLKTLPVMENFLLQSGNRLQLLGMHMMPDPSAQRGSGIISKIITIQTMDSLQQQLNLDIL